MRGGQNIALTFKIPELDLPFTACNIVAVDIMIVFTHWGVRFGYEDKRRAAAPATTGAENDVPVLVEYRLAPFSRPYCRKDREGIMFACWLLLNQCP